MNKEISEKDLKAFEAAYDGSAVNKVAQNAVGSAGVFTAAYSTSELNKLSDKFNVDVPAGEITNQKRSGRCWMFAGLNVIRTIAMKKLHVKNLELSQAYLMFFDKLEKSNFELEAVLDNLDEEDNSRLMDTIVQLGGQQDGGYWHFFTELVKKYGVCPKDCMQETAVTSSSDEMDAVITQVLTRDLSILRQEHKAGKSIEELRAHKESMLSEIYRILCICIGKPVETFTFDYEEDAPEKKKDEKKEEGEKKEEESKVKRIVSTPKEFFAKYIGADLDEYVSLVNWPISGYSMYQTYTAKLCQNVVGEPDHVSVNVPLSEMKEALIKSLKGKEVCWFACDVSQYLLRTSGYLSTTLLDVDTLFSTELNFDKGERLKYRASACNHAMTFTGVNLDQNGTPDRWKVENSWGDKAGIRGYFVMTDKWFDEFVYEAIVNKKYVSEKVLEALKKQPVELAPWAPVNKM